MTSRSSSWPTTGRTAREGERRCFGREFDMRRSSQIVRPRRLTALPFPVDTNKRGGRTHSDPPRSRRAQAPSETVGDAPRRISQLVPLSARTRTAPRPKAIRSSTRAHRTQIEPEKGVMPIFPPHDQPACEAASSSKARSIAAPGFALRRRPSGVDPDVAQLLTARGGKVSLELERDLTTVGFTHDSSSHHSMMMTRFGNRAEKCPCDHAPHRFRRAVFNPDHEDGPRLAGLPEAPNNQPQQQHGYERMQTGGSSTRHSPNRERNLLKIWVHCRCRPGRGHR
jgi:hypothetical protein